MKLGDLSLITVDHLLPVATLLLTLLLRAFVMALQAVRHRIAGLVYCSLKTYQKKILEVAHYHRPSVLLKRNFGWMLGLLPVVAASGAPKKADKATWKRTIEEADKLYNDHSYQKLHDYLLQFKDEDNAEILWRLARATYEVAKLSSAPNTQKELDFEAFKYVERALTLDPNNFAVHKWMFILLDKKSSYEGLKQRISKSFAVKQHIERACELNPKDGTSLHLLGFWCFSVAELPWYQRQIASTLFATPPVSSYQEALQYFLQAEEVEPNFYSMNLLLIGKTYMRLKDKEKAVYYLTKARDYPAGSAEDAEAKQEAAKLLQSL